MKTLENKTIISTRPISDNDSIKTALIEKGAIVFDFPMIKIVINDLNAEIRTALANINTFSWLLFTSKNGVDSFFKNVRNYSENIEINSTKIAVIGEATANEVIKNGVKVDFISSGNTSNDFITELKQKISSEDKILIIQGELADKKLETELAEISRVTRLNMYKTVDNEMFSENIINRIKREEYDLLIFTSPSGFRNFAKTMKLNNCSSNFKIACIGKTTENTVLELGYTPLIVSKKTGGDFFAQEIENYFKNKL